LDCEKEILQKQFVKLRVAKWHRNQHSWTRSLELHLGFAIALQLQDIYSTDQN